MNNKKYLKEEKNNSCPSTHDISLSKLISKAQKRAMHFYQAQYLRGKMKSLPDGVIPFSKAPSERRYGKTPAERNIYIMKISKDVKRIMSQPFLEILQIIDSDAPSSVFDFNLEKPLIIKYLEDEIANRIESDQDTYSGLTPWNITLKEVIHILDMTIFGLTLFKEEPSNKKASSEKSLDGNIFSENIFSENIFSENVFSANVHDEVIYNEEAQDNENDITKELQDQIKQNDFYLETITRMIFITYILPMLFSENDYNPFADNSNIKLMEKWHSLYSNKTKGTNL